MWTFTKGSARIGFFHHIMDLFQFITIYYQSCHHLIPYHWLISNRYLKVMFNKSPSIGAFTNPCRIGFYGLAFSAGSVRTWTSSTPWKPPPRPGAWRPTSRSPSPRRRSSSSSTEPRWMGNRRLDGEPAGFGTWKCWGKHGKNVVKRGETWYIKLVCEHCLPLLMSFEAIQTKKWGMIRMIRIHPGDRDEATDSSGDVHRSWCSYWC